jgi:hypothetical protein
MRALVPNMKTTRNSGAARVLGACVAILWLAGLPAVAGEPVAPPPAGSPASAKADKLPVATPKGDLLNRPPERAEAAVPADAAAPTVRPAAAAGPAFAARGVAARKLVDVGVRDGGLWINSFATRTMPLDAPACAELGDHIVSRLPLSVAAAERLADDDLMRQTRVCAANGSLLVTCYGGTATVSLRPLQHRDGCGG